MPGTLEQDRPRAPKLSVVLVNYNTTDLAVACLRSLREHLEVGPVEVILVDNASQGFDPAPLEEAWPGLVVIAAGENLGFGRGNNLGAARAAGEYLWLLNTDTYLEAGNNVAAMVEFLDRNPGHAATSPLLADAAGTVQPWQTGYFPSLWRMALAPMASVAGRRAPALRPWLARVDTNHAPIEDADVDQAVAAALVVRSTAFRQVGGFSPEYFFFLEDTDLCRKLAEAGWRIRWMPGSRVVHLWGRSVKDPVGRQRMFFAAQDIYFRRWHRPAELAALRVMRLPLKARARAGRVAERRRRA